MEFSARRSTLLREINLLQGVVEKKNTIPILTNVLIEASQESGIKLVATDLDLTLYTTCEADVVKPGAIVLQAKKLFDVVRSFPDSDIKVSRGADDWVTIVCGSSRFRMISLAKEHFPSTPQAASDGFGINGKVLHSLIERTIMAITQEESRYALGGSLFSVFPDRLEMAATDGHRLALADAPLESNDGVESKVIIPRKTLTMLLQLTSASDDPVRFSRDDNHIFFEVGHRILTSRMLAGQFPNYDLVMPKNNDKSVILPRGELAQSIRRVALMADERSHGIRFALSDGALNLTSQTQDVGEANEAIQAEYKDEPVQIGFNSSYLLDFLNVLDCETVVIELKEEQSPALLKPGINEAGASFKYVVLPMRLSH